MESNHMEGVDIVGIKYKVNEINLIMD